jgi:acetyltransferase-like isoleucine patch superfamily enzyme
MLKKEIRTSYYRALFHKLGKGAYINGRISVRRPEGISIGSKTTINDGVFMNGEGGIEIGKGVSISTGVIIHTNSLIKEKLPEKEHYTKPIKIEDGVWLGSGVIINPGVTIGKNTVIGAGSVVTHDIPANSLALGVPAKVRDK